ncbi:MAG: hypothetical protein IJZ54_06600 [Clostridia bacterium]|nr:hypothetical protein [Clostridia bacterium]
MKKILALTLALMMIFALCACGAESNNPSGNPAVTEGAKDAIDQSLTGKWYGPNGDPELDIKSDGTGSVLYQEKTFDATFSAKDNVFTVTSEGYNITGDYTLEEEKLTVTITFADKEYVLIFTRSIPELPQPYIYVYEDETYEINPQEGEVIVVDFPRKDDPPTIEIFLEEIEINLYQVHVTPPPNYGSTSTTIITQEGTTPGFPVPTVLDDTGEKPKIKIGDGEAEGYTTSYDITGTWTTMQDGSVSFFGITNPATVPITYTFNADGTGTILAMGIFPGTMTYSVDNGVLNLTVSMLGDTESGTGYVERVGDTLFVWNMDEEVEILSKVG